MQQLDNNVIVIIVLNVMTKLWLKENQKQKLKKKESKQVQRKFIFKAPNHKFVSDGSTACNLSLNP